MPDSPTDRDKWREWTYSEAVALGAYGPMESHVNAMEGLAADSVQGAPPLPTPVPRETEGMVPLPQPH